MKNFYQKMCFSLLPAFILSFGTIDACTGIKLVAKDGSTVNGRTLEFGIPLNTSIAIVPRGYEFVSTTPLGDGLKYKSKYAAIGAFAFDNQSILDGLNEKGLSIGVFLFPGFASYSEITEQNQAKALSPLEFSNWIITQFATIDEIKKALNDVVIASTIVKNWGDQPPPFHYIVYDKNGESLIIEPINGKLLTYDNKLGAITNSPNFDWHLTNLRNYINLKNENAKNVIINGVEFAPLGQGSGLLGLPGDFTPPSRFVRATILSSSVVPVENAEKAVFLAFHLLNLFDIPIGIVYEKKDDKTHFDFTSCTSVKDPQSLKYYFKTYDDQTIKFIDLKKFDFNAKIIKKADISGTQKALDISSILK